MKTMVEAAGEWMLAGLPLRVLKIVLYDGIDSDMSKVFLSVKEQLMNKNKAMKVGIAFV